MSLNIPKRHPFYVGQFEELHLILVGCGGTGSFLADNLGRLAYSLKQEGKQVRLTFIDPDIVEAKNIGRQKFCPAEIGQPKAATLAERYSYAYGLNIVAAIEPVGPQHHRLTATRAGRVVVLLGAVDTAAARADIAKLFEWGTSLFWLDCGNNYQNGQIIIGNGHDGQAVFDEFGYCQSYPYPHRSEPDLIQTQSAQSSLSCAEALVENLQSFAINSMIASQATAMLHALLLGQLDYWKVVVDLQSGVSTAWGIEEK